MKLHVVYDKQGNIVAAVRLDAETAGDRPGLRVRPVAKEDEGDQSAELHVPPEYSHMDLSAVCKQLRVDVKTRFPTLKPKE